MNYAEVLTILENPWLRESLKIGIPILMGGIVFYVLVSSKKENRVENGNLIQNPGLFESPNLKYRSLQNELEENEYLEISVPKESSVTKFTVQQQLFKIIHSIYTDPISGEHGFSKWNLIFLCQKLARRLKIRKSEKKFLTLQIWSEYPTLTFRIILPKTFRERVERAILGIYPEALIENVDERSLFERLEKYKKHNLLYGQSRIRGSYYLRLKTFKDVSADPVESLLYMMDELRVGENVVLSILVSPVSHFWNQLTQRVLEKFETVLGGLEVAREATENLKGVISSIMEKARLSLFDIRVSYFVIGEDDMRVRSRISDVQAILGTLDQKNMNHFDHSVPVAGLVESFINNGFLRSMVHGIPPTGRLFRSGKGEVVSESELYSLWHLPSTNKAIISGLKLASYKKLPATHSVKKYQNPFFIPLGIADYREKDAVKIGITTWDDAKKHIYILGGTGSGKSETLKRILDSILHKHSAVFIIDPKNDFATDLLTMVPEERANDVIYFNPAKQKDKPLSIPLFTKDKRDLTDRVGWIIETLKRVIQTDGKTSWGPELENILRNLILTAYSLPEQSLSGLYNLLGDTDQIRAILKYLDEDLQKFWNESILQRSKTEIARYLSTTKNKLGKFLDYKELKDVIDTQKETVSMSEILKDRKIFIANLGQINPILTNYYSVYLTSKITEAIFMQSNIEIEKRNPCVFVVDEFQIVASDLFDKLLSQARAFNASLVLANQYMGQFTTLIQRSVESNVATKIFMRTQSPDDADLAVRLLGEKVSDDDIVNLPTGTAYIKTLINGVPQDAMGIKIEKVQHPRELIKQRSEEYLESTGGKYGTPAEEIESERQDVNTLYYQSGRDFEFTEVMKKYRENVDETPINKRDVSDYI